MNIPPIPMLNFRHKKDEREPQVERKRGKLLQNADDIRAHPTEQSTGELKVEDVGVDPAVARREDDIRAHLAEQSTGEVKVEDVGVDPAVARREQEHDNYNSRVKQDSGQRRWLFWLTWALILCAFLSGTAAFWFIGFGVIKADPPVAVAFFSASAAQGFAMLGVLIHRLFGPESKVDHPNYPQSPGDKDYKPAE